MERRIFTARTATTRKSLLCQIKPYKSLKLFAGTNPLVKRYIKKVITEVGIPVFIKCKKGLRSGRMDQGLVRRGQSHTNPGKPSLLT